MRAWLTEAGYDAVEVTLTAESLAPVDVVAATMWNQTLPEQDALGEFVRAGGGLLTISTAWAWADNHPQLELVADFAGNRLLAPVGIQWSNDFLKRTSALGFATDAPPNALTHALSALDAIEAHEDGAPTMSQSELDQAFTTLTLAARCMPPGNQVLATRLRALYDPAESDVRWPTENDPVGTDDLADRLAATLYVIEHGRTPAESVRAHPSAADFPGAVPVDAPRIARRLTIDTAVPRWHSTGLYAGPGELVTVRVATAAAESGALQVRVGAHTDGIWRRAEWTRMPEISRRFPVSSPTTRVANAFGGLIYIEVSSDIGKVDLEIEGAVAAPLFVLGETDPAAWRAEIRHAPAPWAEIAGRNMIVTTDAREVRELDDPTAVATTWDTVLDLSAELAAWSSPRASPERFVVDREISVGYMHAGYPLMAHLDVQANLVDAAHLRIEGNWSMFHEVGHNHQNYDWTFNGTTEVTVNLFTLYVYESLIGILPTSDPWPISNRSRAELMALYNFNNPDFEQWKREHHLALIMYVQMQQKFGWEAFQQVFAEYLNLPDADRPKSDDDKRDQWLVRFSRTVGRNLGPFFEAWGVPTSQAARDEVADLPAWLPTDLPSRAFCPRPRP